MHFFENKLFNYDLSSLRQGGRLAGTNRRWSHRKSHAIQCVDEHKMMKLWRMISDMVALVPRFAAILRPHVYSSWLNLPHYFHRCLPASAIMIFTVPGDIPAHNTHFMKSRMRARGPNNMYSKKAIWHIYDLNNVCEVLLKRRGKWFLGSLY